MQQTGNIYTPLSITRIATGWLVIYMFFLLSELKKDFKTNEQRHASAMPWEIQQNKTRRKGKQNDAVSKIQWIGIRVVKALLPIGEKVKEQNHNWIWREVIFASVQEPKRQQFSSSRMTWKSCDVGGVKNIL